MKGGMGLGTVIFIVLLTLKLAGIISWSWWLVFAPVLLGLVIWALIVILIIVTMSWLG